MYSNKEILSAIVSRWAEPLVTTIVASNTGSIPFVAAIENKVKSSGWASPSWSIARELAPFTRSMSQAIVAPLVNNMLEGMSDEMIPAFAHGMVDEVLCKGEDLQVLDGKIIFSQEDMRRLKNLLDMNLPVACVPYKVKENEA